MHANEASSESGNAETLDAAAEQFLERLRNGEHPSLREYQEKHPQLATEIAELFPTLAALENYDYDRKHYRQTIDFNQPDRLGDYKILAEIGRGGMGIVYEAEHMTLRRKVALKVLPNGGKQDNRTRRFLREARAAGQLHHTNIVPVFDIDQVDGVHFYAMQLIHGQSLDTVLDELRRLHDNPTDASSRQQNRFSESTQALVRELSTDAATESNADRTAMSSGGLDAGRMIGGNSTTSSWSNSGVPFEYYRRVARGCLQVAEAISFAHMHGVLHRDIKPSNLLLDTEGVIWVSDFGLAKDDSESLTHTGDIVGTLRYMAPERFSNEGDARSDVYSIGLTLYEMCTLRYAFDETDRAKLIHQITHREPLPPRRVRPEIPRDLETIILKSTAHDSFSRYQTAEQLAEDLRRFLSDRPLLANRVSSFEKAARWLRRNPSYAMLFGCLFFIATLLPIGAFAYAIQARMHASALMDENKRALAAQQAATEASLSSKRSLFESYVAHARANRWSRRRGQRFETLAQIHQAAELLNELDWEPEEVEQQRLLLRNIAIASLPLIDLQEIRSWDSDSNTPAALSHDGTMIAWSEGDGIIRLKDVESGHDLQQLQGFQEPSWGLWFDPSDRYLLARFNRQSPPTPPKLFAWDLETGTCVFQLEGNLEHCRLIFDPEKPVVYICRTDGHVDAFLLPNGELLSRTKIGLDPLHLRLSPEGHLAFPVGNRIELVDFEGQPIESLRVPCNPISIFEWTPTGGLYASDHDGLLVYRKDANSEFIELAKHRDRVVSLLLNRRGDLAFASAWGGHRAVHQSQSSEAVLNLNEFNLNSIATHENRIALAMPFRNRSVWEFSDGAPLREITTLDQDNDYWGIAVHPKHHDVVALASERGIDVWDLSSEQLLVRDGSRNSGVAFSPDGKLLYVASIGDRPLTTRSFEIIQHSDQRQVRLGNPLPLSGVKAVRPANRTNHLSLDRSGKWLATLGMDHAIVVNLDDHSAVSLGKHANISRLEMSPDARFVSTTTWHGRGLRLWDARSGKLLHDLMPSAQNGWTSFSPDGKWLALSCIQADCIWDTATWTRRTIARGDYQVSDERLVFSPDSKLLMVFRTAFQSRLIDVSSGREVAVLETPNGFNGVPTFTPDGSKLILAGNSKILIWDLAEIRQELENIGLAW
ncbi:MAG: WD40 repeat domain-containing serine/threonine protein kinase [bacterium]|nr:WD40 repeat domain-containing serine/threonine protein kinase [bacterium]